MKLSPTRTFSLPLLALSLLAWSAPAWAAGDPERGARGFRACAACHSTTPERHMTGPSLARIWERKAGTVEGFSRYTDELRHADVTWTEDTLDKWLTSPEAFIPGTSMVFPGLRDSRAREDVIAYLKRVAQGKAAPAASQRGGKLDLKSVPPAGQVTALGHCGDTYTVKTADGKVNKVWEFNLRLKSDSSDLGPREGKPVIVGAGMQGDRASIVFTKPSEISSFIGPECREIGG